MGWHGAPVLPLKLPIRCLRYLIQAGAETR